MEGKLKEGIKRPVGRPPMDGVRQDGTWDFRVFEGGDCLKDLNGDEEHNLRGDVGYEYCYRCGKAWNLSVSESKNIWSL